MSVELAPLDPSAAYWDLISGLGFKVWVLGFQVQGLGSRNYGLGFGVLVVSGFRV